MTMNSNKTGVRPVERTAPTQLGQLYNLSSFQSFSDERAAEQNLADPRSFSDADAGIVLARSLTAVDPQILRRRYPGLTFLQSGIGVDNSGGYAERIQTLRTSEKGSFRESRDTAANKGHISVTSEDGTIPVVSREADSSWSETDIRTAALENRSLPSEFLEAHNSIYQQEIDEIGFVGKESITEGLLNHSAFDQDVAPGPAASLSSDELYGVFSDLIRSQWDQTANTPEYMATQVAMPTTVLNILSDRILNTAAGPSTVLTALKANYPDVNFFATARAGNVDGSSSTTAYNPGVDCMKLRLPRPLEIGEIVRVGSFKYLVESMYRIGGLDVIEPSSGRSLRGL